MDVIPDMKFDAGFDEKYNCMRTENDNHINWLEVEWQWLSKWVYATQPHH